MDEICTIDALWEAVQDSEMKRTLFPTDDVRPSKILVEVMVHVSWYEKLSICFVGTVRGSEC